MQETKTIEYEGFTWELRLPSNVDTELAEGRCWDLEVRRWMDRYIKPGMIVLDVGANFGFFSLIMSRLVGPAGRVFAFEPEPGFCERLRKHIEINSIENVTVKPFALWNVSAVLPLIKEGPPYFSSARVHSSTDVPDSAHSVMCKSLDDIWDWERLDFIKIDVDGCELEVLCGASILIGKYRPIIVVEIMIDTKGLSAMKLLQSLGYVLHDHKGKIVTPEEIAGIKSAGTVNLLALPKEIT